MAPDSERVNLSMPKDLVRKARGKAIAQGTTLSAVVREFLQKWIAEAAPETKREPDKPKPKRK